MVAERILPLVALAALTLSTGCAGARSNVTADDARYPVSLSRAVRDADGEIVAQERWVKVAAFQHRTNAVAIFYSYGGGPKTDISKVVNEQIAKHGGDAIVNLRVAVKQCGLNFTPLLYLIPLFPGCAQLKVEGDIVKVAPKVVPPSAPSPTSPTTAVALQEVAK